MVVRAGTEIESERRALAFCTRYADVLKINPRPAARRLLIIGGGASSRVETELCLLKALELAGCRPIVLVAWHREALNHYYGMLPQHDVYVLLRDFPNPLAFYAEAEAAINRFTSLEELMALQRGPVRIGGHAVSSARRQLGMGTLDWQAPWIREKLSMSIAASLASAVAAEKIIEDLRPSLVLTEDTAYTPRGEFLDTCGAAGIPVIRWYAAHKSGALMLKRYTSANRDHDINSLSEASWQAVQKMYWGNKDELLARELSAPYLSGDWYNEDGAQFGKTILGPDEIRARLRLHPSRQTAFIFPHVGWDASFGRGDDLFRSYDDWLVASVNAACANDSLRWVIRIHPAHSGKEYFSGTKPTDEAAMLRERLTTLPPHVTVLPAESEISTLSLFPVMDYCVTVRGTIGIEAACRGIPVITGGAGRYDRKGFTIDPSSSDEYLSHLANLQHLPAMTREQIALAQRFAYGLFLLRPLPLKSVDLIYDKGSNRENLNNPVKINIRTRDDWNKAVDLKSFADWALNSNEEDFLLPISGEC